MKLNPHRVVERIINEMLDEEDADEANAKAMLEVQAEVAAAEAKALGQKIPLTREALTPVEVPTSSSRITDH